MVLRQVLRKMSEDRPYFEARGAWNKAKGDFNCDGFRELANSSLMWEKMVGYRLGMILECNGRCPCEMVKCVVTYVKAKPVKNRPMKTKKCKMCCIKSVQTICK